MVTGHQNRVIDSNVFPQEPIYFMLLCVCENYRIRIGSDGIHIITRTRAGSNSPSEYCCTSIVPVFRKSTPLKTFAKWSLSNKIGGRSPRSRKLIISSTRRIRNAIGSSGSCINSALVKLFTRGITRFSFKYSSAFFLFRLFKNNFSF